MGSWSLYFLVKLGLHAAGLIQLDVVLNLLFAVALAWPWAHAGWRRAWRILAWPVGVALLYHDSFWPPALRVLSQWQAISGFSMAYLVELVGRVINVQLLVAVVMGAGVWWVLKQRLRLATWVFVGLSAVAMLPSPDGSVTDLAHAATGTDDPVDRGTAPLLDAYQLDQALQSFHDTERGKILRLPKGDNLPAFDLVVLSVCSLSWDDLAFAGLKNAPFMRRLDVVFDRFNSAASYSGPAVMRLLHGTCGQPLQHELYGGAVADCYLFRNLEQAGYRPALLLNHDGRYDNFSTELRRDSGLGLVPEQRLDAPVHMSSFDGSPIRDDGETLTRWWRDRTAAASGAPLALLYNTITLHDGNRVPGIQSLSSLDTYAPRARKLMADLEQFAALIESSGRPTVLVLVPEHGAAVRGDAQQIAGLRELPTPAITHVPAGLMMLGMGKPRAQGQEPVHVEQVSSYLSLFTVVASLMHGGPDAAHPERLTEVAQALPPIEWVSENDKTIVLQRGPYTYVRGFEGRWRTLNTAP
jgi:cellulose synthase operon protein YhjU